MSETLAAALAKAQGEMQNATLNKTNPHFRSRYADLAAIRDAVTPALSKHGLSIMQFTRVADGGGLILVTRIAHSSGEAIEGDYPLPLIPDKPQAMGSAMTYARRYCLAAMCGIAAEEDDDGNEAQATGGNGKPQHRPQTTAPKANAPQSQKAPDAPQRAGLDFGLPSKVAAADGLMAAGKAYVECLAACQEPADLDKLGVANAKMLSDMKAQNAEACERLMARISTRQGELRSDPGHMMRAG